MVHPVREGSRWSRRLVAGAPGFARAAVRLMSALAWTIGCRSAVAFVPHRVGARIARAWMRGFMRLAGLRLTIRGRPPSPPFFLVANHIVWFDFFPINAACAPARAVMMAEVVTLPVVGGLFARLNPILARRVRGDTPRVREEMVEAMRRGDSLMLAPEATVSMGKGVARFHAALLEPAIAMRRPVHYVSMTCRTPAGWPKASECLAYPDPYYGEGAADAPPSFLAHLWGILSLPYAEVVLHFGAEPLCAPTAVALAEGLREGILETFVPYE